MELKTNSTAGTMESSDIMIMLEPRTEGGIELELTSSVMQQFGKQILVIISNFVFIFVFTIYNLRLKILLIYLC